MPQLKVVKEFVLALLTNEKEKVAEAPDPLGDAKLSDGEKWKAQQLKVMALQKVITKTETQAKHVADQLAIAKERVTTLEKAAQEKVDEVKQLKADLAPISAAFDLLAVTGSPSVEIQKRKAATAAAAAAEKQKQSTQDPLEVLRASVEASTIQNKALKRQLKELSEQKQRDATSKEAQERQKPAEDSPPESLGSGATTPDIQHPEDPDVMLVDTEENLNGINEEELQVKLAESQSRLEHSVAMQNKQALAFEAQKVAHQNELQAQNQRASDIWEEQQRVMAEQTRLMAVKDAVFKEQHELVSSQVAKRKRTFESTEEAAVLKKKAEAQARKDAARVAKEQTDEKAAAAEQQRQALLSAARAPLEDA